MTPMATIIATPSSSCRIRVSIRCLLPRRGYLTDVGRVPVRGVPASEGGLDLHGLRRTMREVRVQRVFNEQGPTPFEQVWIESERRKRRAEIVVHGPRRHDPPAARAGRLLGWPP